MDVDAALDKLGYWGKFQLVNYSLLCFPLMFHAIFYFTYVFTAKEADHRCFVPGCDENQYSELNFNATWLEFAVPFRGSVPQECHRFASVAKANTSALGLGVNDTCAQQMFTNHSVHCDKRVYENPRLSVVTEWDIACRDKWKVALVGTLSSIGRCAGMPLAGFISDRYGRRTIVIVSLALAGIMGMLRSFAWNYVAFVSFEFLDTVSYAGLFSAAFILGMELVGAKKRVIWSAFTHSLYAVGEALLGLAAWQLQDWRWTLRVFYIPALVSLIPLWFCPESIRWLVSKGRTKEAGRIIERAAKMNKIVDKDLQADVLMASFDKQAELLAEDTTKSTSLLEALKETARSKILMMRMLNCTFCWLVNMFVYDGLSLYSVAVAGNQYLNFMLVCLIEVPAGAMTWLLMEKTGHRASMCITLIFAGLSCLAFYFVPEDLAWARILVYMMGKFGITISYTVIYVLTAELFPTNIRHSVFAFCSTFGRVGSILAPQTPLLAPYMKALPVILFGSTATLSGLFALFFPETQGENLPDTAQEAENIGRKKNKKKRRNTTSTSQGQDNAGFSSAEQDTAIATATAAASTTASTHM